MAGKITTMVIKVDLDCEKCYEKIRKVICKIPEIDNRIYDKEASTVTVSVACCNPEKIKKKIHCMGGESVKGIEIRSTVNQNSEDRKLTMLCGSFYIPKGGQGDDSHFICLDKQTVGVADGVGSYAHEGIDAGEYARQLMTNAKNAVQNQPNDKVDLATVLNEAYTRTKAEGASTACLITLYGNSLHAVNLGDSGFLVIRNGETMYRSPTQQHGFNAPYQLGSRSSDKPEDALVLVVPVEAGDVIVAGSDGLFDNAFETQIEEVARPGIEQGWDPEEVAQTIAEYAHSISMDKEAFTPFMKYCIDAQKDHRGGKRDDITVIVSCIVIS